jgi:SAM-dependent methyltransferase
MFGETFSYDRYRWFNKRIKSFSGKKLIDLGCGRGTYCLGFAKKGFNTLGVNFDEKDIIDAKERAKDLEIKGCKFEVLNLKKLYKRKDLFSRFDIAICSEVIEHIIDDKIVIRGISKTLKNGGTLLLTAPFDPNAVTGKLFPNTKEDGRHVRQGYNIYTLKELLDKEGFVCKEFAFCSGTLSQYSNRLMKRLSNVNYSLGRAVVLPLKILYPLLDRAYTWLFGGKYESICVYAVKK